MGGTGLLPPACFSPRKSRLMPACPGRLPSPTALILNRQQLGINQGVWRLAPISGPLHVPLGWQAFHGVPKLSSKEVAFFWGCPAPSSQCSNPNSAPSSGPWIAPVRNNLSLFPAEPVKQVQDAYPAWHGGRLAQSLA